MTDSLFPAIRELAGGSYAADPIYATQVAFYYTDGELAGIQRNYANGHQQLLATYALNGSSVITDYNTFGQQVTQINGNADGSRTVTLDKYTSSVATTPSTVEQDVFNGAGKIQTTDITLAFGVHDQIAQTSGVSLIAPVAVQGEIATASHMHGSLLGSDAFIFGEDFSNETIFNFKAGNAPNHDVIDVSKSLAPNFQYLLKDIANSNGDADIHFANGQTIFLHGVAASALTASDFHFI